MKFSSTIIFLAFALISLSSFAKECEIEVSLSADASSVILYLTEKDNAAPDDELVESIIGSKREQSGCEELSRWLTFRDLKANIEGIETPIKVVNLSEKAPVSLFND